MGEESRAHGSARWRAGSVKVRSGKEVAARLHHRPKRVSITPPY